MNKDSKFVNDNAISLDDSLIYFDHTLIKKTNKFKVVKEFSDLAKKDTKKETAKVNKPKNDYFYAIEITENDENDDDLYGKIEKDKKLKNDKYRSFVEIGEEINSIIYKNGVKTDIGFNLLASMTFSHLLMIPYKENNLNEMKVILKSLNQNLFIFDGFLDKDFSKVKELSNILKLANDNKKDAMFVYLNHFKSQDLFEFLKPVYSFIDNQDSVNYIYADGKMNIIPKNIYFIFSLDKDEFPYEISRRLLRFVSYVPNNTLFLNEVERMTTKPINLEEMRLSLKNKGANYYIDDNLMKKMDGLVSLINKTNGYFIQNKIQNRLENYLVALSFKDIDDYEKLDICFANNFAYEAFITKDYKMYFDEIDIVKYLKNAFGSERMERLISKFEEYLSYTKTLDKKETTKNE